MDAEFLSNALPAALQWMRPFIPYLPPVFIDMDAFCAAEPPAYPSLVAATLSAVLAGGELGAGLVAADLILQTVQAAFWYRACECSSGTAPTPPTPPSPPSGTPIVNPVNLVPVPSTTPCVTFTITHNAENGGHHIFGGFAYPPGVGATMVVKMTNTIVSGGGFGAVLTIKQTSNVTPFGTLRSDSKDFFPGQPFYFAVPVDPAHYGGSVVQYDTPFNSTGTSDIVVTEELYCRVDPGQQLVGCCPPDPAVTGLLSQILDYVRTLQRQLVPFAYNTGTVHTPLSGAGSFAIQGLLGIKVDSIILPDSYGRTGTSPTEFFDLGFITLGTADGYPQSYRFQHDPLILFPPRCSAFTSLAYDFAPGVFAEITEVLREP